MTTARVQMMHAKAQLASWGLIQGGDLDFFFFFQQEQYKPTRSKRNSGAYPPGSVPPVCR